MAIINNIGYLKNDLVIHGLHMTAFHFSYKNRDYDVLFENGENIQNRRNKYASVILHFIDVNEPQRIYTIEANQVKMFFQPKEFRAFFGIRYTTNLGSVFDQFFQHFLGFVPREVPTTLNERQNKEINRQLADRGVHNPDAVYCYDARRLGQRNGHQMHRSIFISNLTQRVRPSLYDHFKKEPTVTFYYSQNAEDERSDIEIIDRFASREDERRRP